MHSWTEAAADLVLGAFCPGCGAAALPLCGECARDVVPNPREIDGASVPAVAAGEHVETLRRLIVTWKDRGRHGLTAVLAAHLAASVVALELDPPLLLIPVPTSRRSRRARGIDLVQHLGYVSAQRLTSLGVPTAVVPMLSVVRTPADQAGLTARQRWRNVAHTQQVVRRPNAKGSAIVVDDIWTTGATTGESVRALAESGVAVQGIAVVAVTPLRQGLNHHVQPRP